MHRIRHLLERDVVQEPGLAAEISTLSDIVRLTSRLDRAAAQFSHPRELAGAVAPDEPHAGAHGRGLVRDLLLG